MSDYPMLISNKLHSFRNFELQKYKKNGDDGELATHNGDNTLMPHLRRPSFTVSSKCPTSHRFAAAGSAARGRR